MRRPSSRCWGPTRLAWSFARSCAGCWAVTTSPSPNLCRERSPSSASTSRSGALSLLSSRPASSPAHGCSSRALGRPAGSRIARKSQSRESLRDFDVAALRLHLCLRRSPCRIGRRFDRAALSALRRHRHALPGAGIPVGDAGRCRNLRGAGPGGRRRRRHGGGPAVARHAGARRSAGFHHRVGNREVPSTRIYYAGRL